MHTFPSRLPIFSTYSFLFVRHGETEPNQKGVRCGGDWDVPLTANGCEQICQAGKLLSVKKRDIRQIVSSNLIRTRQTAMILNEFLGRVPLYVEPLLGERILGGWNGLTIAETEPLLRANVTPPGGESEAAYQERIEQAVVRMMEIFPQRLLVVGSKGTVRMLTKIFGGETLLDMENAAVVEFTLIPVPGGATRLEITNVF